MLVDLIKHKQLSSYCTELVLDFIVRHVSNSGLVDSELLSFGDGSYRFSVVIIDNVRLFRICFKVDTLISI